MCSGGKTLFWRLLVAVVWGFCGALFTTANATTPSDSFTVDATGRWNVLAFYNLYYLASEGYGDRLGWTGSVGTGVPGTTTALFKEDVRRRINFYRALTGMPADIVFGTNESAMDQEAALMFSANNQISHTPPSSWTYYTTNAASASGSSNIAIGYYGPGAVDAYMCDTGANNKPVGHRRWLLYSQQQTMGTGDVPNSTVTISGTTTQYYCANAIWIMDPIKPSPLLKAVTWPNAGYSPVPLLSPRWSISYPGADFSAATVTMLQGATPVGLTVVSSTDNWRGDNTLVWEPTGLPSSSASLPADVTYTVNVAGVKVSGTTTGFAYNVTLFDPAVLGTTLVISGTNAPYTTGGAYTFNAIPVADSYELRVSTNSSAPWTEGAEDLPTPQIQASTTGTYSLRQSDVVHTGSKAFHLAFPGFVDQSFFITRDVLVSGSSQLQFYHCGRFATNTTTLSVEISTDNGNTWAVLKQRNGAGLTSDLWYSWVDQNHFVDQTKDGGPISLGTYAGQIVKIRFALRYNNSGTVINTDTTCGFFIDDITVTNAIELVNTTVTTLSGTAASFALNATTAGAPLAANTTYSMRVRPSVGQRWYGDSALKMVTAQAPLKYSGWVAALYPTVTGGAAADQDRDGLSNGVEFAFGLNPSVFTSFASLPQPTLAANTLSASFTQPDYATGVTYAAEWSSDLVKWTAIPDTGTSPVHTFSVSTAGKGQVFFRYRITLQP